MSPPEKTATFVKAIDGYRGNARLYRLYDGQYVVAEIVGGRLPGSNLWLSDEDGHTEYWSIDDPMVECLTHEELLESAGYKVTD